LPKLRDETLRFPRLKLTKMMKQCSNVIAAKGFSVREWAQGLDLNKCKPQNNLSTTGYCLANPGRQYLIYQPDAKAKLGVKLIKGKYFVEWFDPNAGKTASKEQISAGSEKTTLSNPVDGEAVLFIYAAEL